MKLARAVLPADRGTVEQKVLFLGRESGRLNLWQGVASPLGRHLLIEGRGRLVRRPSTDRYEALVKELATCQHNLEDGRRDPLDVATYALGSVIEFMNSDSTVMDAGITNPLSVIMNALHNCRRGGRPRILFDRPRSRGRPTDQAFDGVKAAAAMGVEVLLPAGLSRTAAGKFVAAEAVKLGFRRPDGKQITGRTVLGWRDEIETSKSEIGAEVFRLLKARRAKQQPITDVGRAKALATEFLQQARFAGFSFSDVSRSA